MKLRFKTHTHELILAFISLLPFSFQQHFFIYLFIKGQENFSFLLVFNFIFPVSEHQLNEKIFKFFHRNLLSASSFFIFNSDSAGKQSCTILWAV
jgi:hypothetical protein